VAVEVVGALEETEAVDLVGAMVDTEAVEDSGEVMEDMANMDRSNYVRSAHIFFKDFLIKRVIIPRLLHGIYI
jgi:hypothetical protein